MNDLLTKTQRDAWCYMFESDRIKRENAELRKDKERLDWLLFRYDMGVIMYRDEFLENREDIDKAMEESE